MRVGMPENEKVHFRKPKVPFLAKTRPLLLLHTRLSTVRNGRSDISHRTKENNW